MNKKSVINKIKELFSSVENEEETIQFVDVKTEDGKIIRVSDLKEGVEVKEITEDGEVELEDATYVTEEEVILVVKDGKIEEIKEKEKEEEEDVDLGYKDKKEMEEEVKEEEKEEVEMANVMRIDGVAIYYEGTELSVGTSLFLDEELTEPAPEGPHELEGGLIIVVEDGKVSSIEEVMGQKEKNKEMEEVFTLINSIKEELEELKEENNQLKSRFNKFADEPSEDPIKEKISFNKISREDKLKFFSKK